MRKKIITIEDFFFNEEIPNDKFLQRYFYEEIVEEVSNRKYSVKTIQNTRSFHLTFGEEVVTVGFYIDDSKIFDVDIKSAKDFHEKSWRFVEFLYSGISIISDLKSGNFL